MNINIKLGGSAKAILKSRMAEKDFTIDECVLDALGIWNRAVDEIKKGGKLCIVDSDGAITPISTMTTRLWMDSE